MGRVLTGAVGLGVHGKQAIHQVVAGIKIGNQGVEKKDQAKFSFLWAVAEGGISGIGGEFVGLYAINSLLRGEPAVKIKGHQALSYPVAVGSAPVKNGGASGNTLLDVFKESLGAVNSNGFHVLADCCRVCFGRLAGKCPGVGCKFEDHNLCSLRLMYHCDIECLYGSLL